MTTNTDHYLVTQTLEGNTQAFSELVERYQQFVFTLALRVVKVREEAEEVAQDSFLKAFEALESFRGEAKFSSWLYSIVYRKALDRVRKNNKTRTLEIVDDIVESETETIENALHCLEVKERNKYLQAAISDLSEDSAAIVSLFYFEELSIKEIASITELSEDNVKIKLYRSRKRLYALLKHYVLPEYTDNNGKAI